MNLQKTGAAIGKKFACLLAGAFTVLSCAGVNVALAEGAKSMSADLLQHLEKDKFSEIRSVGDLPDSVKAFYTKQSKVDDIKKVMADTGKDFNSSCVQTPGGAPSKSFLVAAKSPGMCLLYYESGGFVLLDTIDMFKLDGANAEKVWSSSMFKDHPETAEQLVQAAKQRVKEPIK